MLSILNRSSPDIDHYIDISPQERQREVQSLGSVTLDGDMLDDGRTNCVVTDVEREGHKWYPTSFTVCNPSNFHLNHISIFIDGCLVQRFDRYFFLCNRNMVREQDNILRFIIPTEYYQVDKIYNFGNLSSSRISVSVNFTGICERVVMHHIYTLFSEEQQRLTTRQVYQREFIRPATQELSLLNNLNSRYYLISVNLSGLSNGLYFTGVQKSLFQNLQITLGQRVLIDWDETDIGEFCTDRFEDVMYIPFNNTETDYNVDSGSFHFDASINLGQFQNVQMRITLKEDALLHDNKEYALCSNVWNVLNYTNGYGTVEYPQLRENNNQSYFSTTTSGLIEDDDEDPTNEHSDTPQVQDLPLFANSFQTAMTNSE